MLKLGWVLTACNDNPMYSDFIPIFIKAWKTLFPDIKISIVFIANEIPKHLRKFSELILFKPITGISEVYISQIIRLFYPALINSSDAVIITDMDMIPMNRSYYLDGLKDATEETLVVYRKDHLIQEEIAMCYSAATPKVWSDLFQIESLDDIYHRLTTIYPKGYDGRPGLTGWFTDQKYFYQTWLKWTLNNNGKTLLCNDSDLKFRRLDRPFVILRKDIVSDIVDGKYSDYHSNRPHSQFHALNDKIVNLLSFQD